MSKKKTPSPNGSNGGRNANGRFAKGNSGGPGNPYGREVARIRAVMLQSVSDEDLRGVVAALVSRAKSGDVTVCEVDDKPCGLS